MPVLNYLQLIVVVLWVVFPIVLRWFEKRGVGMSCYLLSGWMPSGVSQLSPSQPSFYLLPFSLDILIELLLMHASRFLGLSKLKEVHTDCILAMKKAKQ